MGKIEESKPAKKVAWTGGHTSSDWFGAIITYYWYGKKIPFNEIYHNKHWVRNAIVGWTFKMVLLAIFLYILYLNY